MTKDNDQYENLVNANRYTSTDGILVDIVEKYTAMKDVVVDIYQRYFAKLKDDYADLGPTVLQYAQNFQRNVIQQFANALLDTNVISVPNGSHLANLFVIASFFLTISSIGSFIGSYIANIFLSFVFIDFGALLVALIIIPFMSCYYFYHLNIKSLSDDKRRITAALFVLEQGIMIGFFNRIHYMDSPFMVLSQITSSFVFPLALSQSEKRDQVLGAVAGCSFVAHFVHGAVFGILSPGFLFLALAYSLSAVAFIQYTLAYRARTDFDDIFITMHYAFFVAGLKMVGLLMFGVSADQYADRH